MCKVKVSELKILWKMEEDPGQKRITNAEKKNETCVLRGGIG